MGVTSTPAVIAATLVALVDTLIPGDDLFPPASATGTQALVAERLRNAYGSDGLQQVIDALGTDGRSFLDSTPEQRREAIVRLESQRPDLFLFLRMTTYLAYYATPPVVEAVRRLGHDYQYTPQPQGYEMKKFDFTPGVNVPMKPKGWFKHTDFIERIDLTGLEDLGLPVQEAKK
jgi:hypothetical protein